MKWMTFIIPSYNSEAYLHKCVDSLLKAREDIEIIIVNDGSTDQTRAIADQYQQKYPNTIRVIHKSNGGHGSTINTGIKMATGLYFKVVDSDDWVNATALNTLLKTIKENHSHNQQVDMYITNFIYDKVYEDSQFVRRYHKKFTRNCIIGWGDVKKFYGSEVILMHALTFKTSLLQSNFLSLPEHTFYVDNLYAYQYLPFIQNMFYLDVDLYHYFIGREDQSVNYQNFTIRYRQQIRVITEMVKRYTYDDLMAMEKGLKRYMLFCLSSLMIVTIMFTTARYDVLRKESLKKMWLDIKEYDKKLYRKLRFFAYPAIVNWLPFRMKGIITRLGYKFLQRKVKLG